MMNGMSLHPYPKGGLTQGVKFPYLEAGPVPVSTLDKLPVGSEILWSVK